MVEKNLVAMSLVWAVKYRRDCFDFDCIDYVEVWLTDDKICKAYDALEWGEQKKKFFDIRQEVLKLQAKSKVRDAHRDPTLRILDVWKIDLPRTVTRK